MVDSPIVDDRDREPTPEELEQEAAEARKDAELAEEAAEFMSDANAALKALAQHEAVSEERRPQIRLLSRMLGAIAHDEQWGYTSHHLQVRARQLESEAGAKRQAKQADDA